MKIIRIFFRSVRDSFKSIIRNFSLSLASILCATITLILVSVSIIVSANLNNVTQKIEDELNIVIYLNADASEDSVDKIKKELDGLNKIDSYTYKSKDEWKTEISEYSDSFNTVLNYLDKNPLMDSFTVKVNNVKDLKDVSEYLKTIENVSNVKYGEGMVENIISAFDVVKIITIVVVISLVLVTAFLISNTIKLTIFSRRNEIEIMRLVGASNISIKLPFLFEGLIIGILGSVIPVFVTIYSYVILYFRLDGKIFSDMVGLINPYNFIFYVSGIIVIIGALVGMVGSVKAVRKYLKI